MNRRDALKLLAGLPLLGFLKPEVADRSEAGPLEDTPEEVGPVYGLTVDPDGSFYVGGPPVNPPVPSDEHWAMWNGQEWERIYPNPDGKREITLMIPKRELPELF